MIHLDHYPSIIRAICANSTDQPYVSPLASVIRQVRELATAPVANEPAEASGGLRWTSESAIYEFDAAGNLAVRRDRQGETRFEWDANNRLPHEPVVQSHTKHTIRIYSISLQDAWG